MNTTVLLEKLIQIERSIGVETNFAVRSLVQDAQDYLLGMQRERVEHLRKASRRFEEPPHRATRTAA